MGLELNNLFIVQRTHHKKKRTKSNHTYDGRPADTSEKLLYLEKKKQKKKKAGSKRKDEKKYKDFYNGRIHKYFMVNLFTTENYIQYL